MWFAAFANKSKFDRRNGVTLFELLLVLILLVVVGSLAAPLFEGSFSSIRLRSGTNQVLATWSQARTHAIEAGRIFQFRFQPDGNKYRAEPWLGGLEADALSLTVDASLGATGDEQLVLNESTGEQTDLEAELANWTYEEELPETVTFKSAESVLTNADGQRELAPLNEGISAGWSSPILFYPDGTTSAASILVKSESGLFCRATLRSLTGVGRASELLTQDDVDQLRSR